MKLKVFFLCAVALLLFTLTCCGGLGPEPEMNPGNPVNILPGQENDCAAWVSKGGLLPDNPPGAVIDISNDLDRTLTLHFEGSRNYSLSIRDHSSVTVTIQAGFYQIGAEAAGLTINPTENYHYEDKCLHQLKWARK